MNKITIIQLLNKIANGEEVPKRIKYKNEIRDYVDDDKDYICRDSKNFYLFYNILTNGTGEEFKNALNDEVEIIEEKKIPERITTWFSLEKDCENDNIQYANHNFKTIYEKVHEIIDYLESKEKGE